MENEIDNDPKEKEDSNQLVLLICEAISSSSTEDKIWVPLDKIREYIDIYYEGNFKDIEKDIIPTLRMLVEQELIIRKANTFCFMSAETYQLQNDNRKKSKKLTKSPRKTIKSPKK